MRDKLPFEIKKRQNPSGFGVITVSLFALLGAFLVASIVFWAYGANPVNAYRALFSGAFGGLYEIS
ncbi:MAG: ABC transporter permease, partial [Candidatus Bipolaricaulota bacterium]